MLKPVTLYWTHEPKIFSRRYPLQLLLQKHILSCSFLQDYLTRVTFNAGMKTMCIESAWYVKDTESAVSRRLQSDDHFMHGRSSHNHAPQMGIDTAMPHRRHYVCQSAQADMFTNSSGDNIHHRLQCRQRCGPWCIVRQHPNNWQHGMHYSCN